MILSCDPPRHAFLIHFGKRRQPGPIRVLDAEYGGARVQVALNESSAPPTLVAVHFVRHGFRLPFVRPEEPFSTRFFHIWSGFTQNRYFFHFEYEPRGYQEWQAAPGLTVLVSPVSPNAQGWRKVEDRPLLSGLRVDRDVLQVDVDMSEFVFGFGSDNLKDVDATLFVEYPRSGER
jgi:hypothetical protein